MMHWLFVVMKMYSLECLVTADARISFTKLNLSLKFVTKAIILNLLYQQYKSSYYTLAVLTKPRILVGTDTTICVAILSS